MRSAVHSTAVNSWTYHPQGGTEQNEDKSNRFLAGLDAKGDRYEQDKPKINFSTKIGKNENSTEPAEYASAYYVTIREIH